MTYFGPPGASQQEGPGAVALTYVEVEALRLTGVDWTFDLYRGVSVTALALVAGYILVGPAKGRRVLEGNG